MLGRTLMQPAIAMSAGVKIARWALALAQDRERLTEAQGAALLVSWGGAVGTQQGLAERGIAARKRLARRLGLEDSPSWHVHRNAWIDLLDRIGLVVLTCGKIAQDLALLSQGEIAEMREAPAQEGVGGSSAMPHKRNPVGCMHALAGSDAHARIPRDAPRRGDARARTLARPLASRARARARDRFRARLEPRLPRHRRGIARRRRRADEGEPRSLRRPRHHEPADKGTMDELLDALAPYLA
jgi:hypothetical protein